MSETAIDIRGLGKSYRIGLAAERPDSLGRAAVQFALAPFRYLGTRIRKVREEELIWALKDVTFEVARGEVIGIIGRNGAGKSTLLKILSRITDPSEGFAEIHGSVNSLLEVGTGFHPELTGRENIYMNAAMHGMKRSEIDRKMDEIIAFSGVAKFINTPVKRYSSGMYTRLAFAVAAHLDPDILIVDEVLAVGDAQFQKKCLEKMNSVASEGRTVLFVSHNMQAISTLCSRCVLLEEGRVSMQGDTRSVIEKYLEERVSHVAVQEWGRDECPGDETAAMKAVRVLDKEAAVAFDHDMADPITLEIELKVTKPAVPVHASFHVYNSQNVCLFAVANMHDADWLKTQKKPGSHRCRCMIPGHFLNDGEHYVSAFLVADKTVTVARVDGVVSFRVHDYGESRGGYVQQWVGAVRPLLPWSVERVQEERRA